MGEEIPVFLQIGTIILVITGPVTLLVISRVAALSTRNLSQRQWQKGVAVLVGLGVVSILILTPMAWVWAPWLRIG